MAVGVLAVLVLAGLLFERLSLAFQYNPALNTGILVVRTPGGEKRFDRTGRTIGGSASGRKFPFNRIRGSD